MFRLGLEIGEWDIDTLEAAMPMSLLYEWLAFYRLEPWGYEAELAQWKATEYRQFTRTAIVTANIMNGLRSLRILLSKRGGGRRYKVKDFIPDFAKPEKPTPTPLKKHTKQQLTNMYQMLKTAFGLVGIEPKKRDDADDHSGHAES